MDIEILACIVAAALAGAGVIQLQCPLEALPKFVTNWLEAPDLPDANTFYEEQAQ